MSSLKAISGTFSLFFQSSFHLSLTVLVRYRSLANIQLQMVFTTHFGLHSQTNRLFEYVSHSSRLLVINGILTLYDVSFQRTCTKPAIENASLNYNSLFREISNLSYSRFTRRYQGNHGYFLFLRLLICLSSAGLPT